MSHPHPSPILARQGLRIVTPAEAGTASMPPAPGPSQLARAGSSPLQDLLPGSVTFMGGFTLIEKTSFANFQQGLSAWYPLINVDVEAEYGADLALWGVTVEMRPCDAAGTQGDIAWGDSLGTGAAIVIGRDLPISSEADGVWTAAPPPASAIETQPSQIRSRAGNVFDVFYFPPGGDLAAAVPSVARRSSRNGMFVYRIPSGSRLCAALVVRGSVINSAGTNDELVGHAHVQLHCLDTNAHARFSG